MNFSKREIVLKFDQLPKYIKTSRPTLVYYMAAAQLKFTETEFILFFKFWISNYIIEFQMKISLNSINLNLIYLLILVLKSVKCSKGQKLGLKFWNNTEKSQFSFLFFPEYIDGTSNICIDVHFEQFQIPKSSRNNFA